MRKFLAVAVVIAAAAPVAPAATGGHHPAHTLRAQYTMLYRTVAREHGARAPGRNIARYGVRFKWVSKDGKRAHWFARPAKPKELGRSIRTFKRWMAPPVPAVRASDGPSTAAPYQSGARWAIPSYIVMCESGGNYNARNPSGAYGAYQIMPGTAAAYGCDLGSPAGQDQCAARIYARQGPAPWSCG